MNWRLVSLVVMLTLAACGSPRGKSNSTSNDPNGNPNSSSNSNPNSNPNSLDGVDIGARLWSSVCDAVFNCPNVNPELLLVAGRFASEADCRSLGTFPGLDLGAEQLNASIDAGRVRYDSSKADECFAAVEAELCQGGGFEDLVECEGVVEGLIGEGQPCTGGECADGLNCPLQGEEECSGVCMPNCGEAKCTGEQICDFETETCRDPGGIGDPCDWDGDCESALVCDDSVCMAAGMVPEGGDCSSRKECEDDLACIQGRCGSIDLVGSGSTCSLGGELTVICQPGTVCTDLEVDGEMLVGTCGPPKSGGAECRVTFECGWGLYCTAEDPLSIGTCEETLIDGAACTDDQQCQSLDCFDDVCYSDDDDEMICTF